MTNVAEVADPTRRQLGDLLRSRREALRPEAVGLPAGPRRRTSGLRREEVAELAGISVDWYLRLEQGRPVNPSADTIDAIARALRLTDAEHRHLRALVDRGRAATVADEAVPENLRRLVHAMSQPAYVTGRRWDVLAWNDAADRLLGYGRVPAEERNTLLLMLTRPGARRLFGDGWAAEAQRMVAEFRTTYDFWSADPAFADLVSRLGDECPEFDAWWTSHQVRASAAGAKWLEHPDRGRIGFEYTALHPTECPGLKLVVYNEVPAAEL